MQRKSSLVKRVVGLDVARVLAMYLVMLVHLHSTTNKKKIKPNSQEYWPAAHMNYFSNMGVPIFSMMTGYLSHTHSFRAFRVFTLVMQVRFYELVMWLVSQYKQVGALVYPTRTEWIRILFPVATGTYWYVQRFVMLQFLMPFINQSLKYFSDRALAILSSIILLNLGLFTFETVKHFGHYFTENNSYFLLIGTYIIGATLERISKKWKRLPTMIAAAVIFYMCFVMHKHARLWMIDHPEFKNARKALYSHDTPIVLMGAICVVLFFSKISFSVPAWLNRVLQRNSAAVFAVYLIHHNQHYHDIMWKWFKVKKYPPNERISGQCWDTVKFLGWFILYDYGRQLLFYPLENSKWLARFFATKVDPFIQEKQCQEHEKSDEPETPSFKLKKIVQA